MNRVQCYANNNVRYMSKNHQFSGSKELCVAQCGKYGRGSPEQLANSLIVAAHRLFMSQRSVYLCRRLAEVWRHRRYDVTMVL